MAIELPDLDNRSWQELRDWLVNSIPQYNAQWTDFNYSDPGITLLEMLAWVAETLLYRLDRVPQQTRDNFARLIAGAPRFAAAGMLKKLQEKSIGMNNNAAQLYPHYAELLAFIAELDRGEAIDEDTLERKVRDYMQAPFMIVTRADFATVIMESNVMIDLSVTVNYMPTQLKIDRVWTQANHDGMTAYLLLNLRPTLTTPYQANMWLNQIKPQGSQLALIYQQPPWLLEVQNIWQDLVQDVMYYLKPRIPIGLIVNLEPAKETFVNLNVAVVCVPGADQVVVAAALKSRFEAYLDPLTGGEDGQGWSYDVAPTWRGFYQLARETEAVASVETLVFDYAPSMEIGVFSRLGVDSRLQDFPTGETRALFHGLPLYRTLEIHALPAGEDA